MTFTDQDIKYATITLWGEARGESVLGQQAVVWVILNRANWLPPAWWGHTPSQVCLHPHQFSCWNAGNPEREEVGKFSGLEESLRILRTIVKGVFSGDIPDPTHGSTMYEVSGTDAKWSQRLVPQAVIGKHSFYFLEP